MNFQLNKNLNNNKSSNSSGSSLNRYYNKNISNENGYCRLSKLIQKTILSYIFNKRFTLREYTISREISYCEPLNLDYFYDGFKSLHYKYIVSYALVCREWFDIVSTYCYRYSPVVGITQSGQQIVVDSINKQLSNQYSIYRFQSITHIYCMLLVLSGNSIKGNTAEGQHHHHLLSNETLLEWLSRFRNLNRLTICTTNSKIIKEILVRFPNVMVEVVVQGLGSTFTASDPTSSSLTWYNTEDLTSLKAINLDYVHLEVQIHRDIFHRESVFLPMDDFYNYWVKKWRADSIFIRFENKVNLIKHLPYRSLLEIPTIRNIIITYDFIDSSELKYVADNNNGIECFKASVAFGLYLNKSGNHFQVCHCLEDHNTPQIIANNKLEHWQEFCKLLATNKTLKELMLYGHCDSEYHTLDYSVACQISESLSHSLSINSCIQHLTISAYILNDSFFKVLAHSNKTIKYLKLCDLEFNNLKLTGQMLKYNRSITEIDLTDLEISKFYFNDEIIGSGPGCGAVSLFSQYDSSDERDRLDQMLKDIVNVFIDALSINRTLSTIELLENKFSNDLLLNLLSLHKSNNLNYINRTISIEESVSKNYCFIDEIIKLISIKLK